MEKRICSKCDLEKPIDDFYKTPSGHESVCKKCRNVARYESRLASRKAAGLPTRTLTTRQSKDLLSQGLKYCPRCEAIKPVDEFAKSKNTSSHYSTHCKECMKCLADQGMYVRGGRDVKKEQYKRNKTAQRDKRLLRTFGITLEDYERKLEEQGRGCAICGISPEDNGKSLAVDHDHTTKQVRGLLCNNCNVVIGFLLDKPELCLKVKEYLERNNGLSPHL